MFIYDNYYTVSELLRLGSSMLRTKLFYRGATLIRHPFFLRGKPRVDFGEGLTTGYCCRIETFGSKEDRETKLKFGKNCHIGDYVHIAAAEKVTIGNNCLMASKIFISDLDHGSYSETESSRPDSDPNERRLYTSPVTIGDNVWIGEGVCILKGVTIGDGCIIGAGSVVTKNTPSFSIAVGSPAKAIRTFSHEKGVWVSC